MRKGMSPQILVAIIALIATLIVMLVVVYPPFKALLFGAGEKGQCQFSVLLSSISKQATFGFGEITPECKMTRLDISEQDVARYKTLATKVVDDQNRGQPYEALEYPSNEYGYTKWSLQKIIAEELVDCFDRGWRGRLDVEGASVLALPFKEAGAYLCILCSRIRVDEKLQSYLVSDKMLVMTPWLEKNVREGKAYYNVLTVGVVDTFQKVLDGTVFRIDKPQAVMFVGRTGKDAGTLKTYAVGGVGIFDYDSITEGLKFSRVEGIAPFAGEEKAKCTTIIGD